MGIVKMNPGNTLAAMIGASIFIGAAEGEETVAIYDNAAGSEVDNNVEEVNFQGNASEFTFFGGGGYLMVVKNGEVIAQIEVPEGETGTTIAFADGTITVTTQVDANNVPTTYLNGTPVTSDETAPEGFKGTLNPGESIIGGGDGSGSGEGSGPEDTGPDSATLIAALNAYQDAEQALADSTFDSADFNAAVDAVNLLIAGIDGLQLTKLTGSEGEDIGQILADNQEIVGAARTVLEMKLAQAEAKLAEMNLEAPLAALDSASAAQGTNIANQISAYGQVVDEQAMLTVTAENLGLDSTSFKSVYGKITGVEYFKETANVPTSGTVADLSTGEQPAENAILAAYSEDGSNWTALLVANANGKAVLSTEAKAEIATGGSWAGKLTAEDFAGFISAVDAGVQAILDQLESIEALQTALNNVVAAAGITYPTTFPALDVATTEVQNADGSPLTGTTFAYGTNSGNTDFWVVVDSNTYYPIESIAVEGEKTVVKVGAVDSDGSTNADGTAPTAGESIPEASGLVSKAVLTAVDPYYDDLNIPAREEKENAKDALTAFETAVDTDETGYLAVAAGVEEQAQLEQNLDDAKAALTEMGVTIVEGAAATPEGTDVNFVAGAEVFVYGDGDSPVNADGFGTGDKIYLGEDFAALTNADLKEVVGDFSQGLQGDANVSEIFYEVNGSDLTLYFEEVPAAGSVVNKNDIVEINLAGVALDDVKIDQGFINFEAAATA